MVHCSILWSKTGYLVIRWVTSNMHSGMPSLLTTALLIFFCKGQTGHQELREGHSVPVPDRARAPDRGAGFQGSHPYLHERLEPLILGVNVFKVAHRLVVLPAKLAVCLL